MVESTRRAEASEQASGPAREGKKLDRDGVSVMKDYLKGRDGALRMGRWRR